MTINAIASTTTTRFLDATPGVRPVVSSHLWPGVTRTDTYITSAVLSLFGHTTMNDYNDRGDDEQSDEDPEFGPDGFAENEGRDMSAEEIRENAMEMLAEADGAILVTGNVIEDEEAIRGGACAFVIDDYDDETRGSISASLRRGVLKVAAPDMSASLPGGDGSGLGDLLRAIGAIGESVGAPPDADDDEDDNSGPSMFA